MNDATQEQLQKLLAEPFKAGDVKWKPQIVSGNRAMAIAYTNARAVMDRLDDVLGIEGWTDKYKLLTGGSVLCSLSCSLSVDGSGDRHWTTKRDVGSPSEQPDDGDKLKAAFSDALKRAAVKFGIGRYLYRLPLQWVDYDAAKKKFLVEPQLPPWALPEDLLHTKIDAKTRADVSRWNALIESIVTPQAATQAKGEYEAELADPALKIVRRLHWDYCSKKLGYFWNKSTQEFQAQKT